MFFNLKEVHCGNLKIFLLLRFYLISNLGEFRSCKIAILCNLRGPYFCEFGKIQPSKIAKIHQNQHSKPLNVLKWQILNLEYPKLISRKI